MSGAPLRPGAGNGGGDDKALLAGEHVLGLLPPDEARWVEAERSRDPELDGLVQFWQGRFLALDDALPPAPDPGAALWGRIAASLDREGERTAAAARSAARGGNAPMPTRPASGRGPLARFEEAIWSSLAFWRATGSLAALAALALALLPELRPQPLPDLPQPLAMVILETRGDRPRPGFVIEVQEGGLFRVVPLTGTDVPRDRALELWTLRDRAEGPRSLGLVPPEGQTFESRALLQAIQEGQLFEITLEPSTGSPTGRPTGPILFIGNAARTGAT